MGSSLSEAGEEAKKKSGISSRAWKRIEEIGLGYGLLAPALILLLVFEFIPVIFGFYISLCDWRLSCTKMVGFDNYTRAFADPDMWHSILVTATYSIISVPIQLGLALILAYLLFQKIKGLTVYRMLYFMPYITTTVASAAVWAFLFSPDMGPINKLIEALNGEGLRWLGEGRGIFSLMLGSGGSDLPTWAQGPSLSLIAVIIYTTWVFVGYDIVIFLGGLGNISPELYDAAKVDGAQGWQLFRYITFPLLSPTTFFLLIITVIGTFKAFNHIYIMTQGGPGNATTNASIFIFQQLQVFNRYGYSAALSFIVFIFILILTVVQNQLAGKRVVYE
jgi:multiple sugar transport system permease protein